MFDIVLHQPEIPPNTGNIMRLCANTGARLHLIEPLGFTMTEKNLLRAGMDYRDIAVVTRHRDWQSCREALGARRFFILTTRASRRYDAVAFAPGDVLVFGAESCGLPEAIHAEVAPEHRLTIPMQGESRSMNLSNSVAVVLFEAWRQNEFAGAALS